jgi:hypothetical protein
MLRDSYSLKILVILLLFVSIGYGQSKKKTVVSIKGNQFYVNGKLTYKGRVWQGNKIEGLLFNSRMVQGIFDDLNPATKDRFKYPDNNKWSADRNTDEFIAAMEKWKSNGLLCFTLNLQGGSPMGYGNEGWINSAFDEQGDLRSEYLLRLARILDKADELKMVVILGYFYFGQDQHLKDEKAVVHAVDTITNWLLDKGYKNILVEINNECDISYDHAILQPTRVHELIERVQGTKRGKYHLPVGTSYSGGTLPHEDVVKIADFVLLHGNGVADPAKITSMVEQTKKMNVYHSQPIVFNEDDHFNFEAENNHFVNAVRSYASWGYFDYRMKDEGYENGYQSVPVDWGINSDRKKSFFKKLKEITGY